ncbi:MAG: hypothetical protein JW983_06350 [Elusimicrobia bacterium]|nr:hypothetical protein [Elusimicrobiota bacterium]
MKKFYIYVMFLLVVFLSGCSGIKWAGSLSQAQMNPELFSIREISNDKPELWKRYFGKYEIRLSVEPESPTATEKVVIDVIVRDISQDPPVPVKGAEISCGARMPNIPGYIHTLSKKFCYLTEVNPGLCRLEPIVFGMGGEWDLVIKTEITEGETFSAVFPIVVKGPPYPPNRLP